MAPNLFESRFCRFTAPPGWEPLGSLGMAGPPVGGGRPSAVVTENWLLEPTTSEAFAAKQKAVVEAQLPGAKLVDERPFAGKDHADARWLVFETTLPDGARLHQEQLVSIEGPLAGCLTVSAPKGWADDGSTGISAMRSLLGSFEITARRWAREIVRAPLLAGRPEPPTGDQLVAAPRLGLRFPAPAGWKWNDETAVLSGPGGAAIALRREGLGGRSAEERFAATIAGVGRGERATPAGWDRATLPTGEKGWALEATQRANGTWGSRGPRLSLVVFLDGAGPLEIELDAAASDEKARGAFDAILLRHEPLPPPERRLRPDERWLALELEGPWQAAGPGIYLRTTAPSMLLALTRSESAGALARVRKDLPAMVRQEARELAISRDESVDGSWKGAEGFRHSLDGTNPAGATVALRSAWLRAGKYLGSLSIRGSDAAESDALFARCLDAIDVDALKKDS